MSARPVALIGLDPPESDDIRRRVAARLLAYPMLPRVQLRAGELFLGRAGVWDGPVGKVVYHGIFETDLPALAALALWGGPCLPSAHGLLDCRPRIPNLARCRRVSRFAGLPRGYTDPDTAFTPAGPSVAKWGEWHCGEGKERFDGEWVGTEPTLIEPFLEGEAVRVTVIGDRLWQVRMAGDGWKKSIHGTGAEIMPLDAELAADLRRLRDHFDLAVCAAEYIVTADGQRHLLELNHVPNVTSFPVIREEYLAFVANWIAQV
ncbi:MAG TPA: hypothetical protein VH092_04660 [Urbifossiella sp.]|jgi:hypothetical protein|nr:hypothetical protein [Urbifossiella sp.]